MAYLNLVGTFIYREPLYRAKVDALAENDDFLKDNGWQTATEALFFQASVPTGWTQDVANNNRYLRVVSSLGGGGTGGSHTPTTAIPLAHSAHSITAAPTHTHSAGAHTHNMDYVADKLQMTGTQRVMVEDGGFMMLSDRSISSPNLPRIYPYTDQSSSITSGADGAHDHGGATINSPLADLTISYCDIILGTKDAGGGTYTDYTSYFGSGDKIDFDPFDGMADNDAYNNTRLMPATTVMIWGQATAPLAWTKLTSVDDRMLRVVSGAGGGVGGSYGPQFEVTVQHIHATSSQAGHSHTVPSHDHQLAVSAPTFHWDYTPFWGDERRYVQSDGTYLRPSDFVGPTASRTVYKSSVNNVATTTQSNVAHTHVIQQAGTNFTLAYVDVIACSKDSAGAPYPYDDLTAVFAFKKLVSKQRLNRMAQNDEHLKYHTTPAGSRTFFMMASPPLLWTKIFSYHDLGLRLTTGGSGGTQAGGTQFMSAPIVLAHTHGIDGVTHDHQFTNHVHSLNTDTRTANPIYADRYIGAQSGDLPVPYLREGFGPTTINNNRFKTTTTGTTGTTGTNTHTHGGVTGSQLANISLAYLDVIYCQKD
jgi:hypothetical protein